MHSSVQAPLPVDRSLPQILALVRAERRAVIVAPPGSGKTTRIPPALTELGRTILLQPRRVAARTLARRIADERRWTLGEEVGWQIRFERRFTERTKLLVATEGILTARLQSDPLLSDFQVVVLDEFHERSIHADLALALVKQAADIRDDLAVVVMSATMDAQPVADFLGARIITIDARTFPIDVRYAPRLSMAEAVRERVRDAKGHILCFLPGAREIERTRVELGLPNVLPLHGSLDVDAQERALAPSRERKIILATNVAETSLTVEGVTDVIDSGWQKVLRYDAETAVDHLVAEQISLDSADQRAGRAGRTAPGRATRLWDERMILRPQREPDVRRVDLASTALDIIAWGGDPETFSWFERPPEQRLASALELLRQLGAIDGRKLTPMGELLRRVPLHPRLARVLVEAGGSDEAIRVCALLSEDRRGIGAGDALALSDSPQLDYAARELKRVVGSSGSSGSSEFLGVDRP
ncbi:MAG: ATP-dependent helicase HrpB, partial [Acidobacteriota bacterium]|nr:ATP-dependent helicase HrpB [Acidobacteriota bacterium]